MITDEPKMKLKPRLRWRREPLPGGLANVSATPRGYELWYGDQRIGGAHAYCPNWPRGDVQGYYWICRAEELGAPYLNTSGALVTTMEKAKQVCEAYARACLGLPVKKDKVEL